MFGRRPASTHSTAKVLKAGIERSLFPAFAVVGTYSEIVPFFVCHAALLAESVELPAESSIPVHHMGPPLESGESEGKVLLQNCGKCRADVINTMTLTTDEVNRMKHWLARVLKQQRPRKLFEQFIVSPHMKWVMSETGRKLFQRFSCVGFVVECYREAGIDLIDTDTNLPEVDELVLNSAYPDITRIDEGGQRLQSRLGYKGREDLGLQGSPPWRFVLAGYVFHAHRPTTAGQRYVPRSISDANFP